MGRGLGCLTLVETNAFREVQKTTLQYHQLLPKAEPNSNLCIVCVNKLTHLSLRATLGDDAAIKVGH